MEVERAVTAASKKAILRFESMSSDRDRVRVKRKTLEAVLGECERALQLLSTAACINDDDEEEEEEDDDDEADGNGGASPSSASPCRDEETAEFCDLIKSRVGCADFLEKLENAQASVPPNIAEEGASWDMVDENDLWEDGNSELDHEDYVLVREEDIVDGIACFMAAYLLSLKQTKELTPNQLQEGQLNCKFLPMSCLFLFFLNKSNISVLWTRMVRLFLKLWPLSSNSHGSCTSRGIKFSENFISALCKTFSLKKKKGKLRKAWDGSKVIYNVASWGATAIGIYQNPAILKAASTAFWTSCHVISKLF